MLSRRESKNAFQDGGNWACCRLYHCSSSLSACLQPPIRRSMSMEHTDAARQAENKNCGGEIDFSASKRSGCQMLQAAHSSLAFVWSAPEGHSYQQQYLECVEVHFYGRSIATRLPKRQKLEKLVLILLQKHDVDGSSVLSPSSPLQRSRSSIYLHLIYRL